MSLAAASVAASAVECGLASGADAAAALVHRISRRTLESAPHLGQRRQQWHGWEIRLTLEWGVRTVELYLDDGSRAAMSREVAMARAGHAPLSGGGPVVRGTHRPGQVPSPAVAGRSSAGLAFRDLERLVAIADPERETLRGVRLVSEKRAVALCTSRGFSGAYPQERSYVEVASRRSTGQEVTRRRFGALDHSDDVRRHWLEGVVEEARVRTRARPMRGTRADLVLAPRVVGELMGLVAACMVVPFLRGSGTFLSQRRGKRIASRELSLVDRAVRGPHARCRPFDDEGVKTRTLRLIEDGIFTDVLTNRYFAAHYGERPSGSLTKPFRSAGVIQPTNLTIDAGAETRADLLRQGTLYITDLLGFAFDPQSGGFSRSAAGFTLRHGKLHEAVDGFLLIGNLRELLLKVRAVGNDVTDGFDGAFPSLLVRDIALAM